MAYDFKSEEEVKQFLHNLGIEYRFGCYSEKNPEVCHLLGDYLEAINKDYEKAAKVYRANCDDLKYPKSCMKYGTYALLGKGGVAEDYRAAYGYLKRACDADVPDACLREGLLLISHARRCGVAADRPKGVRLLERACAGDNANACYYASGFHISGLRNKDDDNNNNSKKDGEASKKEDGGELVVPKDMKKAYEYASRGCELGNMYCCVNLSQMYARGDGVVKNEELAKKYKQMALDMQNELETNKTLTFQQGLS